MKKSNNPHNGNSSFRFGFEIIFKEDERYYFQFNDTEGEPLLFGKGYSSERSCADGIQAIIRAAGSDELYDLQETKKGKYFFILKSGNHKEIGRSRTFDRLEDLEEQMELLKSIDEDVPQYGLIDDSAELQEEAPEEKAVLPPPETKEKAPQEKPKAVENPVKKTETAVIAGNKSAKPEEQEKMPRYKFSIIYYPDSKIWMLKNDFSDESIKLKTCDGQQIEDFLKAQLPPEELEAPPALTKPEAATKPPAAPKSPKPAPEEVELSLRNNQGDLLREVAKIGSIAKLVLSPKIAAGAQAIAFDAKVLAQSLRDKQTVIIGMAQKQYLIDGRLEIPIYGSNSLKQGLYRFTVDASQVEPSGQSSAFCGSQLVLLN